MKQVVFKKDGIEVWDDGGCLEGWHVSSKDGEYITFVDEGMYHLSLAEKFRDEPPIAEDICSCEDTKEFEKIVAAVEKYEWMLEKKVKINTNINEQLLKEIKMKAIEENRNVNEIIEEQLKKYLQK